ncbi:MAG: transglutaminase-like domain-containing protein [Coriobacteriales bacterium]|jgi:hypothetical protein|nr:transglutaminase-like domain-containing protein [Coriobacteriales bacterium]
MQQPQKKSIFARFGTPLVHVALPLCVTAAAALGVFLLLGGCSSTGTPKGITNPGNLRDAMPVVLESTTPAQRVIDNGKATLDYSNAEDGYICVKSKLDGIKVKVLVKVADAQYQYTINNPGQYITIPLSQGDNTYSVGVWENISGDKYAAVFSQDVQVTLSSEFAPFLRPSQYVSYSAGDESTELSQVLAEGATSDVEAINGIYTWVVENIDYDTYKAETVAPGYLPVNDDTINTKTGICFDYAVLTVSMLREQRIPAKLVIGYAGTAYHAWIRVYSFDEGEVIADYSFNGDEWVHMDPTFNASSKGTINLASLIGNGTNYQPMYYY